MSGRVVLINKGSKRMTVFSVNETKAIRWSPESPESNDEEQYYFPFSRKYCGMLENLPKNVIIMCTAPTIVPKEIRKKSLIIGPPKFKHLFIDSNYISVASNSTLVSINNCGLSIINAY